MNKYDYLKKDYPQFVSKEQLYKICGIAKDTAWVYLNSGIIPCRDTGKKTRRYSIHIDDVITFLEKRDKGAVPSRAELKYLRPRYPQKLPEIKETATWHQQATRYLSNVLKDAPDAVRPRQMAELVGLSTTVIQQHILHGNIEAVIVGRGYIISKSGMLRFILSERYQNGGGCSERYNGIIKGLSEIESNLKQKRNNKREARKIFDSSDANTQVDNIVLYYLDKLKQFPEILTVSDINTLFEQKSNSTLPLLQDKKIRAAKVNGKYMIPNKSVTKFLESAEFRSMSTLHQHLWVKMDRTFQNPAM